MTLEIDTDKVLKGIGILAKATGKGCKTLYNKSKGNNVNKKEGFKELRTYYISQEDIMKKLGFDPEKHRITLSSNKEVMIRQIKE